ncbi:hypothetical protein GOBAR_DD05482 [Gossypium barbadense]|nr:hypothetical protein GOBAR_DD05482 [Gossypium barbadense]
MVAPISYVDSKSTVRGIDIDLNVAPEIDVVGDDVYHNNDPSDHKVDNDSDLDIDEVPDDIDDECMNDDGNINASSYRVSYRKAWITKQMAMEQLYGDFDASYNELWGWIAAMWERFQTLHYPCTHVVAACAKVSLNVEQFIDEVYTLEHMLRVWENKFPVLPDLSTWEVPLTTFELVPNKGLRRNTKGRPQSSKIHSEIEIRKKSDKKLCGVCRLADHNQSKCPLRNYHIGQSSRVGRI